MLKEHSEKLKEALLAANKAKDLEKAKKLVAESQVSYSVDVGYGEYFKWRVVYVVQLFPWKLCDVYSSVL